MAFNPATFGNTPEARAADISADLDRRLRALEAGGPTSRAYDFRDADFTNNTNTLQLSDGPAVNVFVPDKISLVVEVMAQVTLRNNLGSVQTASVQLNLNDGTTNTQYPLIAQQYPVNGNAHKLTAQGSASGGSSAGGIPGGFIVISRDELVRLGLQFGRVWNFALGYVGNAANPPYTFGLRKLWVRVT